ncbi:MAG: STAS domain-containing protein [Rhodospirillales bacterium]|jgi:anti-anti-sigma factor|nr:STAS domain-containing protein [Rhodospirillales bacterium]
MEYLTSSDGKGITVALKGRLTFSHHDEFHKLLLDLASKGVSQLVFDLSSLEAIDSVGLGLLMIARDEIASRHGRFALRNPQGQVKRIFSISKADALFTIL